MENSQRENTKHEKGIFRIFEFVTESIGWLQIVLSLLFIGLILGAIVYSVQQNTITLAIGILIAVAGLIAGIAFANKQWKGKGTIWFLSRVMATPELDNSDDKTSDTKINVSQKNIE